MADRQEVKRLEELAHTLRKKLIEICGAYEGVVHIGGDLSMADMLIGLYHYKLNVNPDDIKMPTRDRFIMSKGHGALGMYITMAMRGFFDYDEIVRTYGKVDSAFGMHPCKVHLPGVECSSGSLGQGLPMAVGMALSARQKGQKHRVYCLMGDGETCEGSVWEAALAAYSYNLGNLIGIVDRNKQFMTSHSEQNIKLEPYADKWRAFGWNVIEINGNNMGEVVEALDHIPDPETATPTMIVSNTIKGKGVSFMEGVIRWHSGSLNPEETISALADIDAVRNKERGEA